MPRAETVRKPARKSAGKAGSPARKPTVAKSAPRKAGATRPPARKAPAKKAVAAKPVPKRAPAGRVPAARIPPREVSGKGASARRTPALAAAPRIPATPAPPSAPAAPTAGRPALAPVTVQPASAAQRPAPPLRVERSPSEVALYAGISEAELLRMPAGNYMNERQLAYFRAMLAAMKQQLLDNADVTSEHLREAAVVPDPADRATIEEEHALELRTRDRERKLMKKIDEAIGRIDDGSYGWCEETGEPIGLPRLLARPTATLSVEAQARRELKQKMYGE
ncbi:MAG: RNA polymerase-binding protein DksA [Burkholderiales bacterium]|nr:RNA polymerase-binding protein DksA [Burkholderiales bacterium]